ncbi:uncharacterized protein TRAVEDRAFT_49705 [Trametes versicolor FP-101664 SS1]|uniref:uncharacterized protein n=1 Tax=Trametes versicolor (strain FP-101664) TaxID=717944 RepID=UPI0004623696|nr:uncharacterized protein TRAVEDRAFT_49705 [Trametes versicolor FP-101664 SS1]EIW56893.1 hypothetical protein TRAVEDRAFT_49705 [Trametes versicolor FP-101664 SS1]
MSNLFEHAIGHLRKYYTTQLDVWVAQTSTAPFGFNYVSQSIGVVNLARLTGEVSLLPVALLCCLCFVAKGQLIEEAFRIALNAFEPIVAKKCATAAECRSALGRMYKKFKDSVSPIAAVDPFSPYHKMFKTHDVCTSCKSMIQERDLHERRATWARLPEVMGIGPLADWARA